MITITDITLSFLQNNSAPKEKLKELYGLLLQTGINFIEINVANYEMLGNVVDLNRTTLKVLDPTEIRRFPGFLRYACRYSGFETVPQIISEIQLNDVRELNLRNKYAEYKNIRIVGLDDLFQQDYLKVFEKINHMNSGRIEFCPQNSCYCASALAIEWLLNGGQHVAASFNGYGGFASLEEVIMAMRITKRHKPNQDLTVFRKIKQLYEEITGETIGRNKAIIGEGIFEVESGIHVDGIFKNGSNYEPFEPTLVGMDRKVIIGKHSGRTTMEIKLKEHGIAFPREKISELLSAVQQESIALGRSISDQEFMDIAGSI